MEVLHDYMLAELLCVFPHALRKDDHCLEMVKELPASLVSRALDDITHNDDVIMRLPVFNTGESIQGQGWRAYLVVTAALNHCNQQGLVLEMDSAALACNLYLTSHIHTHTNSGGCASLRDDSWTRAFLALGNRLKENSIVSSSGHQIRFTFV